MLTELELELIAAVKASVLAPRLRQVDGLPSLDGDDLVKRFAAEAPAVFVAPQPFTVRDGKATVKFGLAGVAKNARGQKEARHGDAKGAIGVNEILDSLAVLLDQAATASTSWRVTGVRFMDDAAFFKTGLYVGAVDVEGVLALDKSIDASTLAQFLRFWPKYDIAPLDRYLLVNGAIGNGADTPDAPANSTLGDHRIVLRAALDDWTPAAPGWFWSKWVSAGNQRSHRFGIDAAGRLRYQSSANGAAIAVDATSSANLAGLPAGSALYLALEHDVDDGAGGNVVRFYTTANYDPETRLGDWEAFGNAILTPGVHARFDSGAVLELGASEALAAEPIAGRIFRAQLFGGLVKKLGGIEVSPPLAVDFDPARFATAQLAAAMATGETWTLRGTAAINHDAAAEDRVDMPQ